MHYESDDEIHALCRKTLSSLSYDECREVMNRNRKMAELVLRIMTRIKDVVVDIAHEDPDDLGKCLVFVGAQVIAAERGNKAQLLDQLNRN